MTDEEAMQVCLDADHWVDVDPIALYHAAELLAYYVIAMKVDPREQV